jgi:asparagine synthase (glutamine-hydrolysing)
MCGIAGVVASDPEALRGIAAMTEALRHRGPDDEGYLYAEPGGAACAFAGRDTAPGLGLPPLPASPPPRARVAFGHRRLSIIDLSPGGHGPMASADRSLWVTYNGEIFNHVELREELRALGHSFRTTSDTEVLLAAWAQWGPAAPHRFNGMWAFALYDARRGAVFLSRDRFGVKPLHYHWDGRIFAFASEIKGVLAHPQVSRDPRPSAIHSFLVEGALDEGGDTFFGHVHRLPAGHQVRFDLAGDRLVQEAWYALPDGGGPAGRTDAGALRDLLGDAVRLRLRSDVPIGTCLSGGLDSSSIAVLARGQGAGSRAPYLAFSVTFDDAFLDESRHLDAVLAATGLESRRARPTAAELVADLPALARAQDEPIASASPYAQWRLARLARESDVKVLLDGQGADEVLAGYHHQYGPHLAELSRVHGLGAALRGAREAAQVTGRPLSYFLGLLSYHALPVPAAARRWAIARAATHSRLRRGQVSADLARAAGPAASERHRPRPSLAAERRAEIQSTSLPALLRYEDRNSMAFGIEARTPFLDYRIVEWALTCPSDVLIRGGWTKAPLREAMAGLLPEAVRQRRDKIGFGVPERRWLREAAPALRAWLGSEARVRPLLRPGLLERWLSGDDESLARRRGLWRVVSLEMWLRHAVDARAV